MAKLTTALSSMPTVQTTTKTKCAILSVSITKHYYDNDFITFIFIIILRSSHFLKTKRVHMYYLTCFHCKFLLTYAQLRLI